MKKAYSLRYRVDELFPNPFETGIYKGQILNLTVEADEPISTTYKVWRYTSFRRKSGVLSTIYCHGTVSWAGFPQVNAVLTIRLNRCGFLEIEIAALDYLEQIRQRQHH